MEERKMKKILTVFAALAMVAGLASSCQKEGASTDNPAQGALVQVKLTAAFEGDSKVTYSEIGGRLTPAWEMDDAILVINPSVDPSTLTVTSIDDSGYATLEGTAEPGLVHLVYKNGITTGDWQNNKIEIGYDGQSINDDMPAVMFADGQVSSNGSGTFHFRNAGAVIGIWNAKDVPANSAISKVTVTGSNLSKATISINDNVLKLTATTKTDDAISTATLSGITVTDGTTRALNTPIFIAVPAGAKVAKVTLAVGTDTYSYTLAAAKECNANDYLYIKTSAFKKDLPAGALPGVFTVSDDSGVTKTPIHFSQGNLVATIDANGAPTAWKFAANQYDYLGNSVANTSIGKTAGDVDLFGWSTDAASNNWGIHTMIKATAGVTTGNFNDWGKAYCEKNSITPDNTWCTLSTNEWKYLFNTRAASTVGGTANARYAKATVNSNAGIILLPDTYVHPSGVTDLTKINKQDAAYTANSYDLTAWAKMEAAGAVFLPTAGFREGSTIKSVGGNGRYWSSSKNKESYAHYVEFYGNAFDPAKVVLCCFGYSVRLITKCQ